MAKTTVYIALAIGAQEPAYPAYVAFRSPYRFVSGVVTVLPEPSPVALAEDGTGSVAVDPGVWLVDEVLPTQVIRRAVVVPESAGIVQYSSLVEVASPIEIGYGPTWAATVLQDVSRILTQLTEARTAAESAAESAAEDAALAASVGTTNLIYTNGAYPPRPSITPAGFARYVGPVPPNDAQPGDEWKDNS